MGGSCSCCHRVQQGAEPEPAEHHDGVPYAPRCPICFLPLHTKRGVQILQCGKEMCTDCAKRVRICPFCKAAGWSDHTNFLPALKRSYLERLEQAHFQCEDCSVTMSFLALRFHECSPEEKKKEGICPNGCKEDTPVDFVTHRLQCPLQKVRCEQCGEAILRKQLDEHHATECPNAEIVCPLCNATTQRREQHNEKCPDALVPCPLHCDATLLRRGQVKLHIREVCPLYSRPCPRPECKLQAPRAELALHCCPSRSPSEMVLRAGFICDVRDRLGSWCLGTVEEIQKDEVLVHFEHWDRRFDERIARGAPRFLPRGSVTQWGLYVGRRVRIPPSDGITRWQRGVVVAMEGHEGRLQSDEGLVSTVSLGEMSTFRAWHILGIFDDRDLELGMMCLYGTQCVQVTELGPDNISLCPITCSLDFVECKDAPHRCDLVIKRSKALSELRPV